MQHSATLKSESTLGGKVKREVAGGPQGSVTERSQRGHNSALAVERFCQEMHDQHSSSPKNTPNRLFSCTYPIKQTMRFNLNPFLFHSTRVWHQARVQGFNPKGRCVWHQARVQGLNPKGTCVWHQAQVQGLNPKYNDADNGVRQSHRAPSQGSCFAPSTCNVGCWDANHISNHDFWAPFCKKAERLYDSLACSIGLTTVSRSTAHLAWARHH